MLINLRNALMAGRRLPYDAELEYIESTGTQYIQTDYTPTIYHNFKAVAAMMDLNDSNLASSLGTAKVEAVNALIPLMVRDNSLSAWQIGSFLNIGGTAGEVHTITSRLVQVAGHPDYWSYAWYDSGRYIAQAYQKKSNPIVWLGKMTVFACSYDDGHVNRLSKSRFYSFSATDVNSGESVVDLIPVRVGTVGYLYDRVTRKLFGNAGTGDFVLGPDVVPVEWLESDGNQYIDTGYVFQFGDDVAATFQPLATPTQTAYFFGADTAYNAGLNVHYDPTAGSTGVRFCYGGGFGDHWGVIMSPVQAFSASTIYACNGNANKRTINSGENTASVQDSGLNNASVILFCGRRNASVRPASTGWAVASRFFGFDVKRNGAGVRAMKPVRVGRDATSWEGAMMDVLTRRIYRNAGTGAFTYGNDLKYPIPAS